MKNSRRRVTKAGKRQSGKGDDSVDRLSNLPSAIIHHILSFLDTRSAIQTSLLSRQWKSAWKHLSVLDLFPSAPSVCKSSSSFIRYVETILSLRYKLNLSKVIFSGHPEELDTEPENRLFAKVIRYALSHETQHLGIRLLYNGYKCRTQYPSADLFGFNSDCSLKTLELSCFSFSNSFRSCGCFLVLRKLDLFNCLFFAGPDEVIVDPFSNLPCLEDLVLDTFFGCDDDIPLRISGLQLLRLRLSNSDFYQMEIYAPKLKHITIEYSDDIVEFTELTLPSLDHAVIRFVNYNFKYWAGDNHGQDIISLCHGLSNATSLLLCPIAVQLLEEFSDCFEDLPSPFTRLKSLVVGSRDDVPFAVLNYLLKGSSDMNPVVNFG